MKNTLPSQRWWDLPAALLLIAALLTSASRLEITRWTDDLYIVQSLAVLGAILGLALGKSRFSPNLVKFFTFAYGVLIIPWQLGTTVQLGLPWLERLGILVDRLGLITFQLANKEAVRDSLLFVVLMSILYWAMSVHAGYILVRYGNAWRAVLPAGLVLFVIHTFDPLIARRVWYLAVYLFFALVLIARLTFLHHYSRWQQNRTALPPHLGLDFIRSALISTTLMVLFAWTAPAMASALPTIQEAWAPVRRSWDELTTRFNNVFASLRPSAGVYSQYYGKSSALGYGNVLSEVQKFAVRVPTNAPYGIRFYWRARAYDAYNNGQWQSTIEERHPFDPAKDTFTYPQEIGRWLGTFEFIPAAYMSTLFVPPQPIWVSVIGEADYASNPDGTMDISAVHVASPISPGSVYEVNASMAYASVSELKAAGTDYPAWVVTRYLQLPESITPRTRQLAQDITAGLETPYEKVEAITDYLRANITYVEAIDVSLPRNQEIIDWFLFDYRKGFCNYYATAEVILLRSLGIPARWSVGYAQGERVERNLYLVRQRDAHAWPEVYFPGIGWVEFEPTSSEPEIFRLSDRSREDPNADLLPDQLRERMAMEEDFPRDLSARRPDKTSAPKQNWVTVVYWIALIVLVGGGFYVLWRARKQVQLQPLPLFLEEAFIKVGVNPPPVIRVWARRTRLPPLTRAYLEINQALNRLGKQPPLAATPAERARMLSQLLPPLEDDPHILVSEYQVELFSGQPANLAVAKQAAARIRRLSISESFRVLFARLQRPAEKSFFRTER